MKKLLIATMVVGLAVGASLQAEATVFSLAPGGSSGAITAADSEASPGGTLLDSLIDEAFSTGDVSGIYSTWVRSNSDGLLFEYDFHVSSGSGEISTVTMRDFSGFTTDAGATDDGDNYPFTINRSPDGITMRFIYLGSEVGAGSSDNDSAFMWVQTNATNYIPGTYSFIDGLTDDQEAFSPVIPEPTSMLLFGTGLLGFVGKLRKRFAA